MNDSPEELTKKNVKAGGIDKPAVKARIKALKAERDQAIESRDHAELKRVRRKIHTLKHRLRKATV